MFAGAQCLVTGGTGFIGRYVVRRLLAQGAGVRLLCRSHAKADRLFGDRVQVIVGDLLDPASVSRAAHGADVIFHLGGVYRFGRRYHRLMLETNVHGTENVLEAAWASRVEKVVHVSSSGVLENCHGLISERDFPARISVREYYRRSKWLAETRSLAWAGRGLPVTIASPTCPLGAEDETPTPTGCIVADYLAGRFPFGSRTALNFIAVEESAAGILAVAESGRSGERYLLGHHNVWLEDFLELLARITGSRAPGLRVPIWLIAVAGAAGELGGSSRLCCETAAHAKRRQWFDLSKAAEELAWRPTRSLEASARAAVDWLQQSAPAAIVPSNTEPVLAESNVAGS